MDKKITLPINVGQGTLTKDATTGDWVLTSNQLGTDTFTGFNRLVFNDKTVALDFEKGQSSYNATMANVCDLIVRSG